MSQQLKLSQFNRFVELEDGKRLGFNAISCGLCEIEENIYKEINSLIANGNADEIALPASILAEFKKGNFILPYDVNELAALRAGHYQTRFGHQGFGLTVVPTFQCNFACKYCFENEAIHSSSRENGVMSNTVCDNLISLCRSRIRENDQFQITWYGGEPLMAKKIISKLTKELKKICKKKNTKYGAAIITNGYFLNKDIRRFLSDNSIGFVQVTIDGDRDTHNQRRPLKSGKGSYDTIISNIECFPADSPIHISIRVNIDKDNAESVAGLFADLKARGFNKRKNISFNFGHTMEYGACASYGSLNCMAVNEFAEFMVDAYEMAIMNDFKISIFPSVQINSCGAVGNNSAVIDAMVMYRHAGFRSGTNLKAWGNLQIRVLNIMTGKQIGSAGHHLGPSAKNAIYYPFVWEGALIIPFTVKA